ncbi:amino acid kinase [Aurantimonas aggregata]|uniref:Amino acid kinase n=1 Tax=Aurantimonas aggregata TaxID=2047720 RepID=A0A6L9MI76_9HYPH|nr:amino acid kinase [Aurantimonas aggregata]NDV87262.1 amino acid kinase [Aurantimonas aggregata]
MKDIVVVKFGGSCVASPDLARWVRAVEKARIPVVIVPGGGPFANTVRRYQQRIGYDDEAAHEMAILAMEQFGCALASIGTRMVRAGTTEAIFAALSDGKIPVWMPRDMVLADPAIPKDWCVTSDSLAAWLAGRLEGARLCLVKQIDVPDSATVDALVGAHLVDECFARLLEPVTPVYFAGPADLASAGLRLEEGEVPGQCVAGQPAAVPALAG